MYKHILIPTDGSSLSNKAVVDAVALAKSLGARVTAINVVPEHGSADAHRDFVRAYGGGWTMPGSLEGEPPAPPKSAEEYRERAGGMAEYLLKYVEDAAKSAGVAYNGTYRISDDPYEAILATAKEQHCDLIAMASHGWRGVKAAVLGSEAHKVITHSHLPVLVLRYAD